MYSSIREEELKNKVANDWFKKFDTTAIIGNIDFSVYPQQESLFEKPALLWAESKPGKFDLNKMLAQLILTIGKARTFDKKTPPAFIGCFDFEKIAFLPYVNIQDIFFINDFNWNVTPSNHQTKEFKLIEERIKSIQKNKVYVFEFLNDKKQLEFFIKNNISNGSTRGKINIDKNNFLPIYLRWLKIIKPLIEVDWLELGKINIINVDFFLADLFVDDIGTEDTKDDITIKETLLVSFHNQGYIISKKDLNQMFDATINLKNKETYNKFWKIYKRPPLQKHQNYIIERRDLLVPQDLRERKGAFFTPQKWVELSQKYIASEFGDNWQDEYFIWDCAAGTGNLLAGLSNKYNIYASTIDQADVNVMHERVKEGANLLESHVFKFDFLNDDFSILPDSLQNIINDEEKRKKLIIYINPPYVEHGNMGGGAKTGVNLSRIHDKYHSVLSGANRELFAQFLIRIYKEINGCKIAEFSKLKSLSGSHFKVFRDSFKAKLLRMFISPSYTFDNVKGKFPIGFKIWDSSVEEKFTEIYSDVYNEDMEELEKKYFYSYEGYDYFSKWVNSIKAKSDLYIGRLEGVTRNDFASQNGITIGNKKSQFKYPRGIDIYDKNFIECCVCYSVRKCIQASWINDRDQFIFPSDSWKKDIEFQYNCLIYTIFKVDVKSDLGINHWIPFHEKEVDAKERFESNFLKNYIDNFHKLTKSPTSNESRDVIESGKSLWKYYHSKSGIKINASIYDIREYFQGRNESGKMNNKSNDHIYSELIIELRTNLKFLAKKIEPKVYEHRFLKSID